jgi:GDP-4-dehydro-6-deoxy-D-mannose reductase
MRILITGVTGFVGGHLVEALLNEGGHTLHGLRRRSEWASEWSHLSGQLSLHAVDLLDVASTETLLRQVQPNWIFHLAGYANAGKSFHEPDLAWEGNVLASRRLYEAVQRSGIRPRILYTSTGLVYGDAAGAGAAQVFGEDSSLQPTSPYAASKAAADLLAYQVTRHPGLDVVRVRCFNQIGPRQSADYAVANFARQISAIEKGRQVACIETGDLSGQRDLTDVRDMVRAFILLMKFGGCGEAYNAGSGTTYRMQSILDRLLTLSRVRVEVKQKIDPHRKGDAAVSRADVTKLEQTTGWKRINSLEQTLADTLDYWRSLG